MPVTPQPTPGISTAQKRLCGAGGSWILRKARKKSHNTRTREAGSIPHPWGVAPPRKGLWVLP